MPNRAKMARQGRSEGPPQQQKPKKAPTNPGATATAARGGRTALVNPADAQLMARAAAEQPPCAVCGKPSSAQCGRCKTVHYCGRDCQVAHWKGGHKRACAGESAAKDASAGGGAAAASEV